MKRSISKESQYHNWLIGFPKVKDSSGKRTLRNGRFAKGGSKDNNREMGAIKKHSKVANIVFNVPLTLRDTGGPPLKDITKPLQHGKENMQFLWQHLRAGNTKGCQS